jgi:holin-like protein
MLGLAILLGFQTLGIFIHTFLHLPLPSNVIGLLLFTCSLYAGWVKLEWVEQTAEFLMRHMMLFFLPFVVGSVALLQLAGPGELLSLAVSIVVSTLVVLLAAGWITQLAARKGVKADADNS